jgi:hypothetical protein
MDRSGIGVADDLELVWLHHSVKRIEEQVGILWSPEVYVEGVQSVHVFALVHRVGRWEMPL